MPARSPSACSNALPSDEAGVLDGVVAVDLDVARRLQRQVEHAVARERVEHVGQERDRRVDRANTGPVERELDADLRLLGVPLDRRRCAPRLLVSAGSAIVQTTAWFGIRWSIATLFVARSRRRVAVATRSRSKKPVDDEGSRRRRRKRRDRGGSRDEAHSPRRTRSSPTAAPACRVALKEAGAPRLELAAIDSDAVRLRDRHRPDAPPRAGRVLEGRPRRRRSARRTSRPRRSRAAASRSSSTIAARAATACPKDAKLAGDSVVHMTWNPEGAKVAVARR